MIASAIHSTPIHRFQQDQTGILAREFFYQRLVWIVFFQLYVQAAIGPQLFGYFIEKDASDLPFQAFVPRPGNKAQLPRARSGACLYLDDNVTE